MIEAIHLPQLVECRTVKYSENSDGKEALLTPPFLCTPSNDSNNTFTNIRTISQFTYYEKLMTTGRRSNSLGAVESPLFMPLQKSMSPIHGKSNTLPALEEIPSALIKRKKKRSPSPARLEKNSSALRDSKFLPQLRTQYKSPATITFIELNPSSTVH
jgi:hypothetical protein